jgi:dipeptidase E
VRRFAEGLLEGLEPKAAAIVTTAAEGKHENRYSALAASQLAEMGFDATFVDLETEPAYDFTRCSVIYVCGGNTFRLLKHARAANFGEAVSRLLDRGGVYVGVSAGAIILSPSIEAAATIEPDPNTVGLEDFTGLALVDFEVHPHYEEPVEPEVRSYESTSRRRVIRLSNAQAVSVTGDQLVLVG